MTEKHDENFYNEEDKAAANIGRDDAPLEDPKKRQEFLQQRQGDWDHQDKVEQLEMATERLYQLLKQEGIMDENDYSIISSYIQRNGLPSNEKEREAFPKIAEIERRDEAGEWEKSSTVGQPIKKVEK